MPSVSGSLVPARGETKVKPNLVGSDVVPSKAKLHFCKCVPRGLLSPGEGVEVREQEKAPEMYEKADDLRGIT